MKEKNNGTGKRVIAALIAGNAAVLCLLFALIFRLPPSAESAGPTIYVGDAPWEGESKYPRYSMYGKDYVAVSLFTALPGMFIAENKVISNTMLACGSWYMTFDYANDVVYTYINGVNESYALDTALFHGGMLYVPVSDVASFFGLRYERSENLDGMTGADSAIRISSADSSSDFREILKEYYPGMVAEDKKEEVTDAEDKKPPEPETVIPAAVLAEDAAAALHLARSMEKLGCTATFFLTPGLIGDDPETVGALIACGNEVGIYLPDGASAADAESANRLLYRFYKFKTRLVFCENELSGELEEEGYAPVALDRSRTLGTAATDGKNLPAVIGSGEAAAASALRLLNRGDSSVNCATETLGVIG